MSDKPKDPKFENHGEFRISRFEFRLLPGRHSSLLKEFEHVVCHVIPQDILRFREDLVKNRFQ
jgi:hypothetical protein